MTGWPSAAERTPIPELRDDGPRVVALGGGHGLSMVLRAAQSYARQIVGVVTVADDGGSSGRLTSTLDIPPPGDMRRCLLALCPGDTPLQRVFAYRFTDTDVAGHSTGNLMLAALHQLTGDFEQALDIAAGMLGAVGRIIPVAPTSLHLRATIDGIIVDGQAEIARNHGTIDSLELTPSTPANPRALEAIRGADQIILGPGSLYTSVLSCMLVPGVADAINDSAGRLVYIMNLTTQEGETSEMTGRAHLRTLIDMSGIRRQGTVLTNQQPFEAPASVDPLDLAPAEASDLGWELHSADLADTGAEWPQHAPDALQKTLAELT
ncbi:MAG: uridine diphosphate-N-acetylglucosamine-binding protein YvcK [Acidimicrobiia bacterium]|nr:uridine diphosphate-N-acetylglucosamine-binding protein YvcK [Acidimicrobiia bacterium]